MVKYKENTDKYLYLFLLLICIVFGAYHIFYYIDVQLADDTHYLRLGLQLPRTFLPGYGPLYALFFRGINIFTHSRWDTYFIAYTLLVSLPPIVLYFFLLQKKIVPWLSYVIALFFFISPYNLFFDNWSRIGHYSVTIILIGLIVYDRYSKDISKQILILCVVSFLLGYVRPEFHLAWLIYMAIYFIYLVIQKRYKAIILRATILIPFLVVYYLFFCPLRGGRSIIAFAQQFVANECNYLHKPITDAVDYMTFFYSYFGEVKKISQALFANPDAFLHHIMMNVSGFSIHSITQLSGWLMAVKLWSPPNFVLYGMGIAILLYSAFLHFKMWNTSEHIIGKISNLLPVILFVPTLMACIVMKPNPHYLIVFMPLYIYILYPILIKIQAPKSLQVVLSMLSVILIFFVWKTEKYPLENPWQISTPTCIATPNKIALAKLLKYQERDHQRLLDVEGGINFYVNKSWQWENPFAQNFRPEFTKFLALQDVDIIYCTQAMCTILQYSSDSTFHDFRKHPEQYGFHFLPFTDTICDSNQYYGLYIKP